VGLFGLEIEKKVSFWLENKEKSVFLSRKPRKSQTFCPTFIFSAVFTSLQSPSAPLNSHFRIYNTRLAIQVTPQ
jgi:hypothetical protein